jgi:hypothetical protein
MSVNGKSKHLRSIADLAPDQQNANQGTQRGRGLLEKSLRRYGAGRSVLTDRDGNVIAGNKTVDVAAQLDLPVRVVETDGHELVVVQRTDLDIDSAQGRGLAIADNRTGEAGLAWDNQVLQGLSADGLIDLTDFWHENELQELLESEEEFYTRKITPIIYEPKGEKPDVSELCDLSKTDALIEEIENSPELEEQEKQFLIQAAHRHTVWNYSKVADYYAHSSAAVQELMQQSVLVLIDADKALEMGYLKLSEELSDVMGDDYDE